MLQTVRAENVYKKMGHFLSFHVPFLKYKSIKAIYIYGSERSRYVLSENGII